MIQLTSEIKYLGLTLDKGLTWKQLDNVINKEYRALDVQKHVWENMGIETKGGVLDIHCKCKTHSNLCCGTTGAMKTTLAAGIIVLLHLQLEAEVKAGINRPNGNNQWKPRSEGFGCACMTQNKDGD
jgi:hypothetical protein